MNFFKLYIGDYQRDTAHMTIAEHGAYMLMLQHYYATEKPLPSGKSLHRMLRAQDKTERDAIDAVVTQFWIETDAGIVNERADAEITKANTQAETNGRIARERENKRRAARTSNEPSTNRATNDEPNHSHSHSKPSSEANASGGEPPRLTDPDEIIFSYGLGMLVSAGTPDKTARSFLGGLRKAHGDSALIDKLRECARAKPLQPLEWLAAALPPGGAKPKTSKAEKFDPMAEIRKGVPKEESRERVIN